MLEKPEHSKPDALGNLKKPFPTGLEQGTESKHGTVARNAFHLMLGQVMTTALSIFFSAALGRTLGSSDFGLYFLVSSFAAFAYVLVDWGQSLYVIREVARQPEQDSDFLGTSLVLRLAGTGLAAVPFGIVAWLLGYDSITRWYCLAFIAVSLPIFLTQTYGLVFRAHDRMGLDAWVSVANKAVLLGLALAALALGAGLAGVFVAQVLAGFCALAIAAGLYRRVTTRPLRYSPQIAHLILMRGGAFVTLSALCNIQPYIDAVILSKVAPASVVGWFGAAKTIMGTMMAPAVILGAASFPRLARAAAKAGQIKAEVATAMRPLLLLGALAALGTLLFADDAIAILYGHRHFGPAGIVLKVYAPGSFLLFINVLLGYAIYSLDRVKAYTVLKAASVVAGTALELVLIPIFQERMDNGGVGVVVAFVASEFVVFVGTIFLLRRQALCLDMPVDMGRALGSAALTLLLIWSMPPLPSLIGVPVCVTAFFLCSAGLGLVRREDVEFFRSLLRKERAGLDSSAQR